MIETVSLAIGIGLAVSLLFTELFGLAAGGMVVPGYIAIAMSAPLDVALTLLTAMITFVIVQALGSLMIIYGRRRTVLMILFGFSVGALIRGLVGEQPDLPLLDSAVVGYIIPGLIAIWLDRQGVVETLSTLLTASVVVRLVLVLVLGEEALT